jgi:hypothetical protein
MSDVANDDPAVIGSGPTVPDPTTLTDARAVVERYRLEVPPPVTRALNDPANETPKPGNAVFAKTSFTLAVRPADVFAAVEKAVRALGYESVLLGTEVEGEARAVAAAQARLARDLQAQGRRAIILSGGELTVTLRGKGRGDKIEMLHAGTPPWLVRFTGCCRESLRERGSTLDFGARDLIITGSGIIRVNGTDTRSWSMPFSSSAMRTLPEKRLNGPE